MNRKYDLVIFDVDGTLLDTTQGVLAASKYTIEKMGYEMPDDDVLASFIGPPIQDSFAKTFQLNGPVLQEIATIFRTRYKDEDLLKARPYDGIFTVFDELKKQGIKTAVATYKREDYAITIMEHFGFHRYAEWIHGADHDNQLKKKDIIELCMKESGVTDRSRIVMVGDTLHDALGAQQVGIDFIGVTFGFGFHTANDIGDVPYVGCADSAEDILKFI